MYVWYSAYLCGLQELWNIYKTSVRDVILSMRKRLMRAFLYCSVIHISVHFCMYICVFVSIPLCNFILCSIFNMFIFCLAVLVCPCYVSVDYTCYMYVCYSCGRHVPVLRPAMDGPDRTLVPGVRMRRRRPNSNRNLPPHLTSGPEALFECVGRIMGTYTNVTV